MLNKVIEDAIKKKIKESSFMDFTGVKLLTLTYKEVVQTSFEGAVLIKFEAVCSFKAKKYENNRVKFQINLYDDPTGKHTNTIGTYFDGTFYQA